jgi:hypothetical protein
MIILRMMWKDWGFAASLRSQAKHFLDLAKQTAAGGEREGHVRASIVFSVMSFEAFFFREVIRGFIRQKRATVDPAKVKKVEEGLDGPRFTGIREALEKWPRLLDRGALKPAAIADFVKLLEYRNALTHGDIVRRLPLWGNKLAQEVETVPYAELVLHRTGDITTTVAQHFGFSPPTWA